MGFFSDLKEDLSQAVNELMPEEELDQAAGCLIQLFLRHQFIDRLGQIFLQV